MKSSLRRALATGLVGGVLVMVPAATVSADSQVASSQQTVYVSHTASANNNDSSCANAAFLTVQSAVDAVNPGGTVYLCDATPFEESVVVNQSVNITGVPGATIQSSGAPTTTFFSSQGLQTPNSVVTVLGNANVDISGITIEGPFTNTGGCEVQDYGILQLGTGYVQIANDVVQNIGASDQVNLGGCQYGVAIEIGSEYWPTSAGAYPGSVVNFPGNALVQDTTVSGYQKNGITADGPGTQIQVNGLVANGGGQTSVIGRNGVQISDGATGIVQNSEIYANEYTGTGFNGSAAGVLVFGGCGSPLSVNVKIIHNRITNNDIGVYDGNFSADCSTGATSPTNNQVINNYISKSDGETNSAPTSDVNGNAYSAYQVGIADTGYNDLIQSNTIVGTLTTNGSDSAYGPATTADAPFLDAMDFITYPPTNVSARNNTFDGQRLPNMAP